MAKLTSAAAKCRCIVDAIAYHAGKFTVRLCFNHFGGLVLRQHLGTIDSDAGLPGNRGCGGTVIASQHHDFDAHRLQPLYRWAERTSQSVGNGEIAENFKSAAGCSGGGKPYDGFAFGLENSY